MWKYQQDYNYIRTGLTQDIAELKNLTNDTIILDKIEDIEQYVYFQQTLLLGDKASGHYIFSE